MEKGVPGLSAEAICWNSQFGALFSEETEKLAQDKVDSEIRLLFYGFDIANEKQQCISGLDWIASFFSNDRQPESDGSLDQVILAKIVREKFKRLLPEDKDQVSRYIDKLGSRVYRYLLIADKALDDYYLSNECEFHEYMIRIVSKEERELFRPVFVQFRDTDPDISGLDGQLVNSHKWTQQAVEDLALFRANQPFMPGSSPKMTPPESVHDDAIEAEAIDRLGDDLWNRLPSEARGLIVYCLKLNRQLSPNASLYSRRLLEPAIAFERTLKAMIKNLGYGSHIRSHGSETLTTAQKRLDLVEIENWLGCEEARSFLGERQYDPLAIRGWLKEIRQIRNELAHHAELDLSVAEVQDKLNRWLDGRTGLFSCFLKKPS